MKKILITGITGQLGGALSERLAQKDYSVVCLIRKPKEKYPLDLGPFEVLVADITDRDSVFRYSNTLKGRIDTIVHMASPGDSAPKRELYNSILNGTVNLYDFANRIQCPKFIYFSSILAAGWTPRAMPYVDENFIPPTGRPAWPAGRLCYYGRMKLEAERRIMKLSKNNFTKTIILRPGNIYGPPKLSFVKFVVNLLRAKNKVFYRRAKRSIMWAPIHTQDAIDCVFTAIEKETFNNQKYFLTGEESPTLEELAKIAAGIIKMPIEEMENLGFRDKAKLAAHQTLDSLRYIFGRPSFPDFIYSNRKIKNELGFKPKIKLADGIAQTINWARGKGFL
ncbi:MAG: NAD(P)-dependent oxidoreductase [Candidatus Omnitrophota bacterium]